MDIHPLDFVDLDPTGSKVSGSGMDPDPSGSKNSGSSALLVSFYLFR